VILDLCSASSRYGTRWIVGGGFPVTDRPWKAEERHVARLLGGQLEALCEPARDSRRRYWAWARLVGARSDFFRPR
jgi:hypothetical protein